MASSRGGIVETGVPNLAAVLGRGLAEGSLLLVVGSPGSGKTTFVCQVAFQAASRGDNVVYVSTLSEPASRLLKHQRTFSFWNERALGRQIFLQSIYPVVKEGVGTLLEALIQSVKTHAARILILDGFTTVRDLHPGSAELRTFVNDLAVALAPLNCTVIITSSAVRDMAGETPLEFTMCDGILALSQEDIGSRAVRRIRIWKMRGAPALLGSHALQITSDGVAVYPRVESLPLPEQAAFEAERLSMGTKELDQMMSGGLPRGSTTILAGAPGTGKTLAALQYLMDGAKRGEKGVLLGFRESPRQLVEKARVFNLDLAGALEQGRITMIRRAAVDFAIDEVLWQTWAALENGDVKRLAVDGAGEIERAIADKQRRHDVFSALVELVHARGVTALVTREMSQVVGPELDFADSPLEVLAENLILLRYVEFRGELSRILSVLEMRDAAHDRSIRQYEIERHGFRVLAPLESAEGLLGGIAQLPSERRVKRREAGRGAPEGEG